MLVTATERTYRPTIKYFKLHEFKADESVAFEQAGCPLRRYPTLLLTCRHILLGRPEDAPSEANGATRSGENYGIQFIEARRDVRVWTRVTSTLWNAKGS